MVHKYLNVLNHIRVWMTDWLTECLEGIFWIFFKELYIWLSRAICHVAYCWQVHSMNSWFWFIQGFGNVNMSHKRIYFCNCCCNFLVSFHVKGTCHQVLMWYASNPVYSKVNMKVHYFEITEFWHWNGLMEVY